MHAMHCCRESGEIPRVSLPSHGAMRPCWLDLFDPPPAPAVTCGSCLRVCLTYLYCALSMCSTVHCTPLHNVHTAGQKQVTTRTFCGLHTYTAGTCVYVNFTVAFISAVQ